MEYRQLGRTDMKGTYQLTSGTNEVFFAINAVDSNESNIEPKTEIVLGEYTRATEARTLKASIEYWRWIALASLVAQLLLRLYYRPLIVRDPRHRRLLPCWGMVFRSSGAMSLLQMVLGTSPNMAPPSSLNFPPLTTR